MKMRKTKKVKGMTLVEILVALAIFAMLGSILVLTGIQIDRSMRASNKLKKKMTTESVYAANQIEAYRVNGTDTTFATEPITINVKYGSNEVNIDAYRINTEDVMLPPNISDAEKQDIRNRVNGRLNYQFIKIPTTTAAPPTT